MKEDLHEPPKWARKFLQWFCQEELLEEIEGDLLEAYQHKMKYSGKRSAVIQYYKNVIRFFRPYSFEKHSRTKQYLPMIKNYFLIAFRNTLKRKAFTLINLVGLTISMIVVLLVSVFVNFHLTYDAHYSDSDLIYRIGDEYRSQLYSPFKFDGFWQAEESNQLRLVNLLRSYSEVIAAAQFMPTSSAISGQSSYFLSIADNRLTTGQLLFTNTPADFLDIFPQKVLIGSRDTFVEIANSLLLTESNASRLFGSDWSSQDFVGTKCIIEDQSYVIAGVIQDPLSNSHFDFDIAVHRRLIPSWAAYTYIKTRKDVKIDPFMAKLAGRMDEVLPGYSTDELEKGAFAVPLDQIHVSDRSLLYELKPTITSATLHIFMAVAMVILLITWTNYTNLTIAMYSQRQKELGVRKVLGARGSDIAAQILAEISLISMLSVPLAWLGCYLLLPVFSELMSLDISKDVLFSPWLVGLAFFVSLLTGCLSSIYPSLVFGARNMIALMKSRLRYSGGRFSFGLRRVLIMSQFFMLISLISMSAFVYQQMNFVSTKDMGYHVPLVFSVPISSIENHQALKGALMQMPEVANVGAGYMPGSEMYNQLTYKLENTDEVFDDMHILNMDFDMAQILGWTHEALEELSEGRNSVVLVNRKMAQRLSTVASKSLDQMIGQRIVTEPEYVDDSTGQVGFPYIIDGILADFHFFSLKHEVNPIIVQIGRQMSWTANTVIRLQPGTNINEAIIAIENLYYEHETAFPFAYEFLDDRIDRLYTADQRMLTLMSLLTGIAVLLSIMGLIGLVSYISFIRQKEVGIRKVFGASIMQILILLNREFVTLLVGAFILSIPIIYYCSNLWLSEFAYRIEINPFVIILAALTSLLVVILVVSLQSARSAQQDPVMALKDD